MECLVLARRMPSVPLRDFVAEALRGEGSRSCEDSMPQPAASRRTVLVGLERVTNAGNVGAIARTALGLGASGMLLCAGSADPFMRKAVRIVR